MSNMYDLDDLYTILDAQDDTLREIRGILIAIAAGISGLAELYGQDLHARDPEAYERAQQAIARKKHEWEQMVKEGR